MDATAVQRIVAGQAVTDLASAVKELVDNALDAGATVINSEYKIYYFGRHSNFENPIRFDSTRLDSPPILYSFSFSVRLFDQGSSIVEVSDDGCGIPPSSREMVCTPHSTSKIQSIEDIGSQLGFRGEALFCLANLSANLMIATRTAQEDVAQKLEYQRDGSVRRESIQQIPKKVGTTVAVVNLFDRVPVRRQDFLKRLPQHRTKLLRRMEAYFVFHTNVAMHMMDMMGNDYFTCTERTLLQTSGQAANTNTKTMRETVSNVIGSKVIGSLCDVSMDLTESLKQSNSQQPAAATTMFFKVEGLLSHASPSKKCTGVRERQLFAINRRPVDMPKLSKLLNHLWKSVANATGKPFCFFNFCLPHTTYDINFEPDKRKVVLQNEQAILDCIQDYVTRLWSDQTDGKFEVAKLKAAQPIETMAFESDPEDEEDVVDAAMSPNRFTRRYAFVNDVTRMKLQHQFDDGREASVPEHEEARNRKILAEMSDVNDSSDEEGDQNEITQANPTIEIVDEVASSTPSQPLVQITPQTGGDVDFVESRVVSVTAPSLESVVNQRMSPGELRRFRVMQQSMNSSTDHGLEEEIQLATINTFDRYRVDRVQTGPPTQLYQSERTIVEANTSRPSSLQDDPTTSKRQLEPSLAETESKRLRHRASGIAVFPGTTDVMLQSNTSEQPDASLKEDQRRVSLDPAREFSTAQDSDVGDDPVNADGTGDDQEDDMANGTVSAAPQEGRIKQTVTATVFTAFSSVDEVVRQGRRERIALHNRKNAYESTVVNDTPSAQKDIVSLSKDDFSSMRIIGQFNLGFMLAVSKDNHLWILDQHACDEKYNFEKLMAETVISEQQLIAPMPLELMPAEESCILDNMEIFEKNGFRFKVDLEKPPRHRLALTALPHSGARDGRKAVQFGKEDVSALCGILGVDESSASHDGMAGTGTGADGSGMYGNNAVRRYAVGSTNIGSVEKVIARLPKAIAMFASRACRGSIMIGQALSQNDMDRIVKRLKDVEHPWNCPHGRPTMRHVLALDSLLRGDDRKARQLVADTTTTMLSQEPAPDEDET
jgi:DNA mismatch repair protein PMS2